MPNTPSDAPWACAVDPNTPGLIYVGSNDPDGRNLYRSDNGGLTWNSTTDGLPAYRPSSIVIDPQSSAVLYTSFSVSEGGVVYKSTDGASSWSCSSLHNIFISGIAVDPGSSDTVFAAIKGGIRLAKTTSGGSSWDYLLGSRTDRGAITIDPKIPSTIYTGAGWRRWTNIFFSIGKSTDGGQSWTATGGLFSAIGTFEFGVSDIWVHPGDSSTILVAVAGFGDAHSPGGVYKSTDGGATWQRTRDFWANTLAADPNYPDMIYYGTARNGYVFKSTDGGSSWKSLDPGWETAWEVRDLEANLDSYVYAATDEGLRKWDGSNWTKLAGLCTDNIKALAIDRSTSPGTVYVGTGEDGVFVSQDGGSTWIPVNEGLGNLSITKLAVSASQPIMLYAGTAYGGVWSTVIADFCEGDFDGDGDVDGSDLAELVANPGLLDLSSFAAHFGRTNCPH